ncbi:MarR family winged helix-turn-helix transcriptional regulator [Anaerosinus massiliensis]|uniref:MarR family winged helix-turn-helix transcriptional regulator n=1 Tax=Massilibacillus massiliensis TaxID=1806837 RepID=UPI000DA63A81|nr:MarR family transcriptional regulator [Massilibacillus massiliensis]
MDFDLIDLPARKKLQELSTDFPELDVSAVESNLKFLRTAYEMHHFTYDMLEKFGLSKGKFTILIIMYSEDKENGLNPSVLAQKAGVSRATVTGLLTRLERDGIVERKNDLQDKRMTYVKLSQKGIKMLDKILPLHFMHTAKLMRGLTEHDRMQLDTLLQKIRNGIAAASK